MSNKFPDWCEWLDRVCKSTVYLRDRDPKVEHFEASIANAAGLIAALTIKLDQRRKEIEEWEMQSAKLQEERVLRDALKRLGVDVDKIKSIQQKEFLANLKEQVKGTG
jgi:hypothetical protein